MVAMWIRDVILGAARHILGAALPLPDREGLNFGAGLVATDNALQKRTDVSIGGAAEDLMLETLTVSGSASIAEADVDDLLVNGTLQCDGSATFTVGSGISAASFKLRSDVDETRPARAAPMFAVGDWTQNADGAVTSAIVGRHVGWELRAPAGAKIRLVSIHFEGPGGHGGLPATMPRLSLRKVVLSTGVTSEIAGQSDTSIDASTLDSEHTITLNLTGTGGYTASPSTERYIVRLTAESGSGSLVGAVAGTPYATWRRLAGSVVGQD